MIRHEGRQEGHERQCCKCFADKEYGIDRKDRREKEVLRCTISGRSVKETAEALNIARKTVDNLRVRLMRKLGVHSAVDVVLWAVQHGLLVPDKRLGATADAESRCARGYKRRQMNLR